MPLVILCGFPCSGKTTVARELLKHWSSMNKKVVHIGDRRDCDTLKHPASKDTVYSQAVLEKELRGELKSAVQKHCNSDTIVILDSLNYIKGFRYELFCVSKGAQTTHCVIHCETTPKTAVEWNEKVEPECDRYSNEVIDALVMRFEPPNGNSRWDSPLITILPSISSTIPFDDIDTAVLSGKTLAPNLSTVAQPVVASDLLTSIDKVTSMIVKEVQGLHKIGATKFSKYGSDLELSSDLSITPARLQRAKRSFTGSISSIACGNAKKLSDMKTQEELERYVTTAFIQYLSTSLQSVT